MPILGCTYCVVGPKKNYSTEMVETHPSATTKMCTPDPKRARPHPTEKQQRGASVGIMERVRQNLARIPTELRRMLRRRWQRLESME
jgi:hypothetical protein